MGQGMGQSMGQGMGQGMNPMMGGYGAPQMNPMMGGMNPMAQQNPYNYMQGGMQGMGMNPMMGMGIGMQMNPMMMGMGMQMGMNAANLADENRRLRDQLERPAYNSQVDDALQKQLNELNSKLSQLDGHQPGPMDSSQSFMPQGGPMNDMQRRHQQEMMRLDFEAQK